MFCYKLEIIESIYSGPRITIPFGFGIWKVWGNILYFIQQFTLRVKIGVIIFKVNLSILPLVDVLESQCQSMVCSAFENKGIYFLLILIDLLKSG